MCEPSGISPRIQIHRYEHEEKFQAKSKQPIAQIKKKTHKKVNWKWYINVFFCKELNRIVFQIRLIIHYIYHLNPKTSHSPLPLCVKKWWMCENFKLCSLLHLLWHNALWTIRTNATNIFVHLNMLHRFD